MVKVYCPKCCDVYTPKSSRHHHIDGVYFGTGFPHMLFMVHPELRPPKPTNLFVPRCATSCLQTCGCFCISSSVSVNVSLSCVYISVCVLYVCFCLCVSLSVCVPVMCACLCHTHTHTHTHTRTSGCMGSRSTLWLTSSSSKLLPRAAPQNHDHKSKLLNKAHCSFSSYTHLIIIHNMHVCCRL